MPKAARRALAGALSLIALGLCGCDSGSSGKSAEKTANSGAATVDEGSGFDFYVLSLSWSPSYCAAEGEEANGQQCGPRRNYAFVVHGLWPQHERGYPSDCATEERGVDRDRMASLYDIMPSSALIRHQWRKHGSCSGLSQDRYFDVLRRAREHVSVPEPYRRPETELRVSPSEVEDAFLKANPGMADDGIAVTCDNRYLREVRICMTKALDFRACPEVDRRSCKASGVRMPPTRG
jgi:ribonuclease T2